LNPAKRVVNKHENNLLNSYPIPLKIAVSAHSSMAVIVDSHNQPSPAAFRPKSDEDKIPGIGSPLRDAAFNQIPHRQRQIQEFWPGMKQRNGCGFMFTSVVG